MRNGLIFKRYWKDKFTCKKELYELLVSSGYDKLNIDDYLEMGTFFVEKQNN